MKTLYSGKIQHYCNGSRGGTSKMLLLHRKMLHPGAYVANTAWQLKL
jgi:hypothetical protein